MALYKFNPDDARRFAAERGIHVRQHGNELIFRTCPFCGGTSTDKETFAINLTNGAYNCLRAKCNAKGNMITLHHLFNFDLGTDVEEYERPKNTWKRFKAPKPFIPTNAAIEYLHGKRGISKEVITRYEVKTKEGEHPDDNVLVFSFRDEENELAYIKYRAINFDKTKGGSKEWAEAGMRPILFGIKQCVDFDTLIITEGQIDSLSVATAGFENAVSVPNGKNGMRWVPHNWNWIKKFKRIIVFGDHEGGGMTLLSAIQERFATETCQVFAVQLDDYKGCKDANEILLKYGVEQIKTCINNAKPVMLAQVKKIEDIEDENEADEEYMPTGIVELDKIFNGGLHPRHLDILTGKRGEGKSTFGSMLVKAALESGYNCFIYSGEIRMQDVKKCLDSQIAGNDKVKVRQDPNNKYRTLHEIDSNVLDMIRSWYSDKVYLYDTTVVTEDKPDLLKVVEIYIKQFDCRFVLIDNLMTAVDIIPSDGAEDKYEKQSRICKQLSLLAQKYNALIVLIAHKKKTNGFENADENDDVFGSSEITNVAGEIISYGRGKGVEDPQRRVKVLKNRKAGTLNFEGFVMNYDSVSKRIYGNTKEEFFGPSTQSQCFTQFVAAPDDLDIPF